MEKGGFTFVEACRAFDCVTGVFADALVTGSKVTVGQVGVLLPTRLSSKEFTMGFKRIKGGVEPVRRVFVVGPRLRYRFKVFESFLTKNKLDWFNEP